MADFSPFVIWSRIGLARCGCGRVIAYAGKMATNHGLLSQVAKRFPKGAAKIIKDQLWKQTMEVTPLLFEDAVTNLHGEFWPEDVKQEPTP